MLDLTFIFQVMLVLATLQVPSYPWQQGTHDANEGKAFKYFTSSFNTLLAKLINMEQSGLLDILPLPPLIALFLVEE